MDMGALQDRHFPRKINHENTGMLSYPLIRIPHPVHALGGETIERRSGIRYITTLRNEPTSDPKIPMMTAILIRH